MSERARLGLFLAGAVGFGFFLVTGLHGLPPSGRGRSAYGDAVNATTVPLRQTVNAVTAVVLDYRGFDTLGEEHILFAAVLGVTLLLREARSEEAEGMRKRAAFDPEAPETTDALRVWTLALVAPSLLLGLYLVVHGHLSPGGGFQGGVLLAWAMVSMYLAGAALRLRRANPMALLEVAEGLGMGGFVCVGLAGLLAGQDFLQNVLPFGTQGQLLSAGLIPVANGAVALAVAAGIVIILSELLEQTLTPKD